MISQNTKRLEKETEREKGKNKGDRRRMCRKNEIGERRGETGTERKVILFTCSAKVIKLECGTVMTVVKFVSGTASEKVFSSTGAIHFRLADINHIDSILISNV